LHTIVFDFASTLSPATAFLFSSYRRKKVVDSAGTNPTIPDTVSATHRPNFTSGTAHSATAEKATSQLVTRSPQL